MNYAVAALPPEHVAHYIRNLKQQLQSMACWYPNVNTDAHLTISSFAAGTRNYDNWQRRLADFCKTETPFNIRFDSVQSFPQSNTFYLAPDAASTSKLNSLLERFAQRAGDTTPFNAIAPHINIGRNLSAGQLSLAEDFLKRKLAGMSFECNRLHIRKLNPGRGQYDLFCTQPFGKPPAHSIVPEFAF